MFKSYLKLALRNLWKRKTTTFINVLSLSAGLASCAWVILFFQHELSFDKKFDTHDDIDRVTSTFKDGSKAPTVGLPYAKYLKNEIPEIEQVSRMDPTNGVTIVQAQGAGVSTPYTADSGYWVDPEFFNVLSFHFLQGDRKAAFSAPNTIVLSESLAKKIFKQVYPIGKTLKAGSNIYTITGVFKDDFLNHIQPDFFASNNSDHFREKIANNNNWVVDDNYYTYIKLKHNSNVPHVTNELNAYLQKHALADMKATNNYITNSLQSLNDIHLHSSEYQDYLAYKQGNIKYLYLLGTIALFILILGGINYMNLTTAQAIDRAREVGVRRVLGARKASIRYQFMIETMAISVIAMFMAIGLALLFLPVFNSFTGQSLSFFAKENRMLIFLLLGVTIINGLLASIYPSIYLSSFKAVKVLKGKVTGDSGMFGIRKVLIVSQFIISTCLVFATVVIWSQLHFMVKAKPGFDLDQQLVINLNTDEAKNNSALLISQLKANSKFKSVSGAGAALVSGDMNLYPQGRSVNDKRSVFLNMTDEHYLETLDLKLVSGTNFVPTQFTNTDMQEDLELHDIGRQVILNEEAVKALGFDPYSAPGKYVSRLYNGVVYNYKIMGVMKNYHYFSLHAAIGPCGIMPVNPKRFTTIIAKVSGNNMADAIKYAGEKWKVLNPSAPFSYDFLNNLFRGDYEQDQRQQQMVSTFAIIAVFISCLGLLGLITYSVAQKAKEIGIRKVIGASITSVVALFIKQYFKLLLIANLVAWPVAWYVMHSWLQDFPYRINISWWMFAISLSAGLITGLSTIAFKTIKAAIANPINSLRAE
jgi:putative ABC transport system permease protein